MPICPVGFIVGILVILSLILYWIIMYCHYGDALLSLGSIVCIKLFFQSNHFVLLVAINLEALS